MSKEEFRTFKEELKKALVGYRTITPQIRKKLKKLGLVEVRCKNHHIFEYHLNGKTYYFEIDKTAGDFRSGIKTVRDITRTIRQDLKFDEQKGQSN